MKQERVKRMTTTQNTEIEILPAARPVQSPVLAQLMEHAQAMATAKQLADALCGTDMVPQDYKGKPANGAAAILYGAEIGLNPIQALQNIFVIHGRPAIYARTAIALVKSHGVKLQTIESSKECVTVRGTRDDEIEEVTWTMEDAKQAGYTKNAKYQTNPRQMLYAKAAMEVCRNLAPDILLGIAYSREELELEQPVNATVRATSARVTTDEILSPRVDAALTKARAKKVEPEILATPEPVLPETYSEYEEIDEVPILDRSDEIAEMFGADADAEG
jgi:hypothetical protein